MVIYSGIIAIVFFIISIFGIKKDTNHDEFMSLSQTSAIKGLLALEVFLCHIYAYYPSGIMMKTFNAIAYIPVALFFMFTGYGLVFNVEKKKDKYIKGFLKKRFLKLYIPLWISLIFTFIIKLFINKEVDCSLNTILADVLGLNAIWFLKVIIIYYFVFWLIWSFVPDKYRLMAMCIFVIAQCLFCFFINTYKSYYTSSFGFVIGMFLAIDNNGFAFTAKVNSYIQKNKVKMLILISVALAITMLGYFLLHDNRLFGELLLRNIVGIVIVLLFCLINYNISFGNKISKLLGTISYEIFLIHPAVIVSVKTCFGAIPSDWLQILLILFITIIGSIITHYLSKKINSLLIKE